MHRFLQKPTDLYSYCQTPTDFYRYLETPADAYRPQTPTDFYSHLETFTDTKSCPQTPTDSYRHPTYLQIPTGHKDFYSHLQTPIEIPIDVYRLQQKTTAPIYTQTSTDPDTRTDICRPLQTP